MVKKSNPFYFGTFWLFFFLANLLLAFGFGEARRYYDYKAERFYTIYQVLEHNYDYISEHGRSVEDVKALLADDFLDYPIKGQLTPLEGDILEVAVSRHQPDFAIELADDAWSEFGDIPDALRLAYWGMVAMWLLLFYGAYLQERETARKKNCELIKWYLENDADVVVKALEEANFIEGFADEKIATWLKKRGYRVFMTRRKKQGEEEK